MDFWGMGNSIHLDFLTFSDSLFAISHSFILSSSTLISELMIFISLDLKSKIVLYKVVSSAQMSSLRIELALLMSFMYIINNSGPKIVP